MSQLGSVDSGNKLQKQKKGPWSLGKRKANITTWGGGGVGEWRGWERQGMFPESEEHVVQAQKDEMSGSTVHLLPPFMSTGCFPKHPGCVH